MSRSFFHSPHPTPMRLATVRRDVIHPPVRHLPGQPIVRLSELIPEVLPGDDRRLSFCYLSLPTRTGQSLMKGIV
ncbi:MAG: hypothetical protein C5B49_14495 [Bdellovibrio sp.]|nr:MAG: hypothetical protein C5B49_14495 [Bdellovibrio sp.]